MKVDFVKSIFNYKDYAPSALPEYAFCGRSNAGKSSLINTLFKTKIAHTSKTPGRTRCINLYLVEKKYVCADLPGYGYARTSRDEQHQWKELIESYMRKSPRLMMVFILSDVQRGIGEEEEMLMEWLEHIGRPFRIVFTKIDKLSNSQLARAKKDFARHAPVYFSSVTGAGRKELFHMLEEGPCILMP